MTSSEDLGLSEKFYFKMNLIRHTELKLLDLFANGWIRGTVHTCLGQEAAAVGLVSALDPDTDIVCSNHRGHGHYLAFTGNVKGLLAEILGRPEGICGGIGGSQHLYSKNFYSNGVLGGMPPIACGMAFAEKFNKNRSVVTVFFGDGAMGEGNIYESLNLAALFRCPIIFAVEQNQYAQSTAASAQHQGNLARRALEFGVPVIELDGNNVIEVYETTRRITSSMRVDPRPHMLFMNTYRLGPHSKGDDLRDENEIERYRLLCPILRLKQTIDPSVSEKIENSAAECVLEAINEINLLK